MHRRARCTALCTVIECVTSHTGHQVACSSWSTGSCGTASCKNVERVIYTEGIILHGLWLMERRQVPELELEVL
jgi:hypothetical protein